MEPQLLLKGAKLNAGPDLQMGIAWWSNPQTSVSDPRKDLFFSIYLCTATIYFDIFCSFPNAIFSSKLFLGSNPHHMLACMHQCDDDYIMFTISRPLPRDFNWHLCGHRIC